MNRSIQRSAFFLILSALMTLLVAGCGTVRGFGEDVRKLGEGIKGAAR